jgi:catechol 2,3-dioxygenase
MRAAGSVQWSGMPDGTVMGHLHLRVGDVAGASSLLGERLGFDRMVWQYPGALFLAAGGTIITSAPTRAGRTPHARRSREMGPNWLEWTIVLPDGRRARRRARKPREQRSISRESG